MDLADGDGARESRSSPSGSVSSSSSDCTIVTVIENGPIPIPVELQTTVGKDSSWTDMRFRRGRGECYEPDHISRRVSEAVRINNTPKIPGQTPKCPKTSVQVAEEEYYRKKEAEQKKIQSPELSDLDLSESPEELNELDEFEQNGGVPEWSSTDELSDDALIKICPAKERRSNKIVKYFKNNNIWVDDGETDEENEQLGYLTSDQKLKLGHDPTFLFPLRTPMKISPYWSGKGSFVGDIIIDEVRNPNDFYIRPASSDDELQSLEDRMYDFYHSLWKVSNFLEPNEIIHLGYYAVFSFETARWHRGKVYSLWKSEFLTPEQPSVVKVFFVDHGMHETLSSRECIFHLREEFTDLRIQCALASLNVPGHGGEKPTWTQAEIEDFKEDMHSKEFKAIIKKVDFCPQRDMAKVEVVLIHTVDEEEQIYTFGGRLKSGLYPNPSKTTLAIKKE